MCDLLDSCRKHCVICWMKEERRASRFLSAGKLLRSCQGPFGLSEDWDTFRSLSSSSSSSSLLFHSFSSHGVLVSLLFLSKVCFMQIHQKKWSEAVPSLQHAIRGYPACADLWEVSTLLPKLIPFFLFVHFCTEE